MRAIHTLILIGMSRAGAIAMKIEAPANIAKPEPPHRDSWSIR